MTFERYGVREASAPEYEVVHLNSDEKYGRWLLFAGLKQEVEIRITPSGLLRVSKPRKRGPINAAGKF